MALPELNCTGCGEGYPLSRRNPRCEKCGEPLEVRMDVPCAMPGGDVLTQTIFDRYGGYLPFSEQGRSVSLHEGFTPLIGSPRLAERLGAAALLLKNETVNPTWSFKDRGTVTALGQVLARGERAVGTVSTGNMAVSVAAYGAAAGLNTVVLVSSDIPEEKLSPIAVHGAAVIRVEGDYGELYRYSLELGDRLGISFLNSDVPFRVEGYKTCSFELCEQTHYRVPDYVIVPTSAGGNIRGIVKGFEEFLRCGFIDRLPVVVCAQAAGCAPIHNGFEQGLARVERVTDPSTIAHAIENPLPPSGNRVLKKLREIGGVSVAVSDPEILSAQAMLAGVGLFAQPAGAVPLAAALKMANQGKFSPTDRIALIVTGGGLKYVAALSHHRLTTEACTLQSLEDTLTAHLRG